MEHLHCWCDAHKEKPHLFDFLCAEWWWKNGEDSRPYTLPLNRFLKIATAGNYWKRSGQVSRIFCFVVRFCSVVNHWLEERRYAVLDYFLPTTLCCRGMAVATVPKLSKELSFHTALRSKQ